MRVLVFDDILFHRQADFGGFELDLRFYEHADDAVEVVASERPDVVLMDYSMDEHCCGDEAVAALRERWPRGKLTIVGISSDSGANRLLVDSGADEAVPKSHLRGYLSALQRRAG